MKWVHTVEFVAGFAHIGGGHGGYEDHEFFGERVAIEKGPRVTLRVRGGAEVA